MDFLETARAADAAQKAQDAARKVVELEGKLEKAQADPKFANRVKGLKADLATARAELDAHAARVPEIEPEPELDFAQELIERELVVAKLEVALEDTTPKERVEILEGLREAGLE